MRWQDLVIALCQILIVLALLPTIFSSHKPALSTSVFNVAIVLTITLCLTTLKLWFSAITAFAIALAWAVLAVQIVILKRREN